MLLNNGLSTIELGSINWRQVINQNFVKLDPNRIHTFSTTPTTFIEKRFIYNDVDSKFYYDDGTKLNQIVYGTKLDISPVNANKYVAINATGDGITYKNATEGLANEATQESSISLGMATNAENVVIVGKTESGIVRNSANNVVLLGANSSANSNGAIAIGYKSRIEEPVNVINSGIAIGSETSIFTTGNSESNLIIGKNSYIQLNSNTPISNAYNNTIIGTTSSITHNDSYNNIIIGNNSGLNNKNYNTIQIGAGIKSSLPNSIILSNTVIYQDNIRMNGNSLTISHIPYAINNKQIISVARSNINTNDFSTNFRLFEDINSKNLQITENKFFTANYIISIFKYNENGIIDETNNQIKIFKGKIIGACIETRLNIIKSFTKNIEYEDLGFERIDIQFVSSNTTNNQIYLNVNTNNIACNVAGEIELFSASPYNYS